MGQIYTRSRLSFPRKLGQGFRFLPFTFGGKGFALVTSYFLFIFLLPSSTHGQNCFGGCMPSPRHPVPRGQVSLARGLLLASFTSAHTTSFAQDGQPETLPSSIQTCLSPCPVLPFNSLLGACL